MKHDQGSTIAGGAYWTTPALPHPHIHTERTSTLTQLLLAPSHTIHRNHTTRGRTKIIYPQTNQSPEWR